MRQNHDKMVEHNTRQGGPKEREEERQARALRVDRDGWAGAAITQAATSGRSAGHEPPPARHPLIALAMSAPQLATMVG